MLTTYPFRVSGTILVLAVTAGAGLVPAAALGQAPVDLNTWSQKGASGSGNWTVAPDGNSVFQSINGQPTYFVSPDTFFNTLIEGSFGVETNGDDDYIGFVFGWNEPGAGGADASFLLFNWKQANQSSSEEGFRLAKVNGTGVPPFGNAENDSLPDYDVLAVNTGGTLGWQDNIKYGFSLDYRADSITIGISDLPTAEGGNGGTLFGLGGTTIFDVAIDDLPSGTFDGNAFPSGRFGFYNHSQEDVRYVSFTQTDDPVLSTTPGDGGTLDFGNVRVTGSADANLTVVNTGGLGSSLDGNLSSPVGPVFSGPAGDANFSLGQGAGEGFAFAFAPVARGTFGDSVTVQSNDPADPNGHVVDFIGRGVGPVYDANDALDFGTIDYDVTELLVLDVANDSNDGDLDGLTDLTLLSASIIGPDASNFSLVGFAPGSTVAAGSVMDLQVQFDPDNVVGAFAATLVLETDESVGLGESGSTYEVELTGASRIPEPATLALLAGLAAAALRRRRTH